VHGKYYVACHLFTIVFLNYDGKTLFGTPWEMVFTNTYLVRSKGGNVPGYSAQFSYIPELGLGNNYQVTINILSNIVYSKLYNTISHKHYK